MYAQIMDWLQNDESSNIENYNIVLLKTQLRLEGNTFFIGCKIAVYCDTGLKYEWYTVERLNLYNFNTIFTNKSVKV